MLSEFELIARYFTTAQLQAKEEGVVLGPGDDCALLAPTPGHTLAVSVDTSVAGVHFPEDAPAEAVGHRALAVSLSDLAAMGARPRWCLMALTLPNADPAWLESFARGFHALCAQSGVVLVGGDVTRGPLSISVTVQGEVPQGAAMRRDGARPGDCLAVTGTLGGGHGGLRAWQTGARALGEPLLAAYLLPQPRLAAGQALRGLATAALDVSDGLLADLGHICRASYVGAEIDLERLPLAAGLDAALGDEDARRAALCGGDDYELLIALPEHAVATAQQRLSAHDLPLSVIGRFTAQAGLRLLPTDGVGADLTDAGWQHFRGEAS
ncbi:thiamine-phosphate kinase [Halomonas sp. WWR20]